MRKLLFAFVLMGLLVLATGCGSKSIDLNQFMEIQVSGYDGYGEAKAVFDETAFQTALKEMVGDKVPVRSVLATAKNGIRYNVSKSNGLSNGDKIELDWDVDKEIIKKDAGVILTFSQIEKSITELKAVEEYDAFGDIRFLTEGYSGAGSIVVDTSNARIKGLQAKAERTSGLSNGDVIKVTLSLANLSSTSSAKEMDAYTAGNYGLVLKEKSFQYTVDGLAELEVYDIFKDMIIVTEGYSGFGSIKVDLSGTKAKDLKVVIDKDQDLSNGDTVSVTLLPPYGSEDASAYTITNYGFMLQSQLLEYTVSSLKELEEYDFFSEIKVRFTGAEPAGKLEVDASSVQIPGLSFEADRSENLKNGDEIVLSVKCTEPDMERHLALLGYKLARTEARYTVEGMGTYWFGLEELEGTQALKEMDQQARDVLTAYAAANNAEQEVLKPMHYLGAYFVEVKPLFVEKLNEDEFFNKVCLVYQIDMETEGTPLSYYYYTEFFNVEKTVEGEWEYNLLEYKTPEGRGGWGPMDASGEAFDFVSNTYKRYSYLGFQTLKELTTARISSCAEKYSYEANVDENAPQSQNPDSQGTIPSEFKLDLGKVKVGDSVSFGQYEQDGYAGNGKEPIEWVVFTANDEKVWMISRYILDAVPFNRAGGNSNYGNSSVNRWLNSTFLNEAFSKEEQEALQTLWADPAANPQFPGTSQGVDVHEKVALLSIEEIEEYLSDDQLRMAQGTKYTKSSTKLSVSDNGNSPWWTRTMGSNNSLATLARSNGTINYEGRDLTIEEFGIRPCICLPRSSGSEE